MVEVETCRPTFISSLQNSLGSEEDSLDPQLVDDALEESFSVLEDSKEDKMIFSDDDFAVAAKVPPPREKPPPLPSAPPPPAKVPDVSLEERVDFQPFHCSTKFMTGFDHLRSVLIFMQACG